MADDIGYHLQLHGRVQGVFFRASMQRKAKELGVGGWVRNCPDGSVEAVVCGPESQVDELVQWVHQGPPNAKVDHVEKAEATVTEECTDFEIRYG